MNYRVLLTTVFCLICLCGLSQSKFKRDSIRNLTVQRFQEYFFCWPVLKQLSTSFEFRADAGKNVKFKPNSSYHLGFGVYLFEVQFELTFALPLDDNSKRLYGDSHSEDEQANILGKSWGADLFISDYRGFYKDDSANPTGSNKPFPQRPDIHTHNVGVNGIYILKPNKFSLRSAFNFAERQKKSGGSLTLVGSLNTYRASADSAILSQKYDAVFGKMTDFNRLRTTNFSLAPGYAYAVVFKNVFLNTSLAVGPAVNWINFSVVGGQRYAQTSLNAFIDFRVAIGYNAQRFFTGISFINQSRNFKFESTNFTSSSTTFKVVIGYRFREFGILKKKASDLLFFIKK